MGADIHAYLEENINGTWVHFCNLDVDRSYMLFGVLAGVRDPYVPIAPLRGVPSDASQQVLKELDCWDLDAHSRTWYSLNELLAFKGPVKMDIKSYFMRYFKEPYAAENQEYIMGTYQSFVDLILLKTGSRDPANVRVVMWFDN